MPSRCARAAAPGVIFVVASLIVAATAVGAATTARNDDFASRTPLGAVETATVRAVVDGAGLEPGEPGGGRASLWWTWTAPSDGVVVVRTDRSTVATEVDVFAGDDLASLAVAGDRERPDRIRAQVSAGDAYQVRVSTPRSRGVISLRVEFDPLRVPDCTGGAGAMAVPLGPARLTNRPGEGTSDPVEMDPADGRYEVRVVTEDSVHRPGFQPQQDAERLWLEFLDGSGTVVATTLPTADLPEGETVLAEVVNDELLLQGVTAVRARHAGRGEGLQSISPVCVVLTPSDAPTRTTVRSELRALVLHYNPEIVDRRGVRRPLDDVLAMRPVRPLVEDYVEAIRRASGGQVSWQVADTVQLAEFPPEHHPDDLTAESYLAHRDRGFDAFPGFGIDYGAILRDPRLRIVDRVAAGEIDAVWVFAFPGTGFWEAAMAGDGAWWVNGGPISDVGGRRFIVYGFGHEAHQHHGFMLENTGHALESTLRRGSSWPAEVVDRVWATYDVRSPEWRTVPTARSDWERFFQADALNYESLLHEGDDFAASPGNAVAGTVHFPPNALANYGWSPFQDRFSNVDQWDAHGGAWRAAVDGYQVETNGFARSIAFDGVVRRTRTMADFTAHVEVEARGGAAAGLLFRVERYGADPAATRGYLAAVDPAAGAVVLSAIVDGEPRAVAAAPAPVTPGQRHRLTVRADGPAIQVLLDEDPEPVLDVVDGTFSRGGFGVAASGAATFANLWADPVVWTQAEAWADYPDLSAPPTRVNSRTWAGSRAGDAAGAHAGFLEWLFEQLPKNPGTNADGILNTWWPYLVDPATFDPLERYEDVAFPEPDTTPPAAPAEVVAVALERGLVELAWPEPEDDIGVTRYDVRRDGAPLQQVPLGRFTDPTALTGRRHTYEVVARDGSGNRSSPVTITVDVPTAPTVGLRNGDLEAGLEGTPTHWQRDVFMASAELTWDEGGGRSGSGAARISHPSENDSRWIQEVPGLEPGRRYRFSGWMRGEDVVDVSGLGGARIGVFPVGPESSPRTGTFGWTRVSFEVEAPANGRIVLALRLGHFGNTTTGTVWFDDLQLEPV